MVVSEVNGYQIHVDASGKYLVFLYFDGLMIVKSWKTLRGAMNWAAKN